MKLKTSLKNLVKRGLLIELLPLAFLILGCSSSTAPTFTRETVATAIQDICRDEYKIELKSKLIGQTLWIYLPLEDILVKNDQPEKYTEKFNIEKIGDEFNNGLLKLEYSINPVAKEEEKSQGYKYNKDAIDKVNSVWRVLRRVMFSLQRTRKYEPRFFSLVMADIKNGFEIKEVSYYLDLKKVSYGFISWGEYQHRTIQDSNVAPQIIGDKEGARLEYKDITMEEFITKQIEHRIKLKFQKPEVEKNADIDKEILKAVVYTIKTYDFRDLASVELHNLLTQNRIILNNAAIWANPTE